MTSTFSATAAKPAEPAVRPDLWMSIFHLFVLNAFVVAQPTLHQLQDNAPYIVEQRLTAGGLMGIAVCLMCGLPTVFGIAEWCLSCISRQQAWGFHRVVVVAFCLLQGGLIGRWVLDGEWLESTGIIDLLQVLLMLTCGGLLAWCYIGTLWGPRLVSWSGVGLLIFPVVFLASPSISAVVAPPASATGGVKVQKPVPIVLVVFDGLAGTAIMDENREIDAIRYPNFARLAARAHWFRHTTTVHPRTDHAVPAILSGRYPTDGTRPVLANYPQNLFTLLQQSGRYEATIFEPYTRLAPPELEERAPVRSLFEQVQVSLECLARVYARICLPENLVSIGVPIPRAWFSLPETFTISRGQHNGILRYGWDRERHVQVAHFLETVTKRTAPHLWFLHIGLPHYPFRYYPSGQAYLQDIPVSFPLAGTRGDMSENWGGDQLAVDQAWQRYLLQVGYADRVLGQILDRLEACDLFDQSLLVVTSDHGYSFRANLPQRAPRPETLPDLMPVPLFVKLPGEASGSISDRNVETIDVLPTIADIIGLEIPQPVDGESAFATTRARLRKTLVAPGGTIGVDAAFPQADESRQRMLSRFGSGREDRLWTVEIRPELVGRRVDSFPRSLREPRELSFPLQAYRPVQTTDDRINYFLLEGAVEDWEVRNHPVVIAAASAGQIVAVTRTFLEPEYEHRWNALLPEDALPSGVESLEFWEVLDVAGNVELRSCTTRPAR